MIHEASRISASSLKEKTQQAGGKGSPHQSPPYGGCCVKSHKVYWCTVEKEVQSLVIFSIYFKGMAYARNYHSV